MAIIVSPGTPPNTPNFACPFFSCPFFSSFDNYWFTSGTPAFLIKLIKKYRTPVDSLDNYETDQSVLDAYDVDRMNVVSLLFQTGYLTIRKIKTISLTSRMYHLSFPNAEVKESFLKHNNP